MSDKLKVYSKVYGSLKKHMKSIEQNRVLILAMMITGILMGKKAQLSEMSLHVPHAAKPDSIAKRFQRFVKNEAVDVESYFLPFAREILAKLSSQPLHLALDASQVGRGCMVLMVAVIYKGRALPLAWLTYPGVKGHTTADRHIEALKKVSPLIPVGASVILLGDAEYDNVEMLGWIREHTTWEYVIRTEPRILLSKYENRYPIRHLLCGKNYRTMASGVGFTAKCFGPVQVVAWWETPYKHPIYLVSSLQKVDEICLAYSQRFKLETLFSDQKSRGFHIEKSHLSDPKRLSRLLLAVALAYIWMIYLGLEVAADQSRRSLIDRPNRRDKSLFRLGFDWLKLALTRGLNFNVHFYPPRFFSNLGVR